MKCAECGEEVNPVYQHAHCCSNASNPSLPDPPRECRNWIDDKGTEYQWDSNDRCWHEILKPENVTIPNDRMKTNEWISVGERSPDPGEILVIFDDGTHGFLLWREHDSITQRQVRWWRPFPNPPPRESSRDRWWKSLATVDTAGDVRFIQEPMVVHGVVCKAAAFAIWDAAIAASKREDFVP